MKDIEVFAGKIQELVEVLKRQVAVGRLGAMSGPLVAGQMLALGTGTAGVMLASAPGTVLAAVAVFCLLGRRRAQGPLA